MTEYLHKHMVSDIKTHRDWLEIKEMHGRRKTERKKLNNRKISFELPIKIDKRTKNRY